MKQLGLIACVVLMLPVVAAADEITAKAEVKAPLQSWTPLQQWTPSQGHSGTARFEHGYGNLAGTLLWADELADKLSELGRASLVDMCFRETNYSPDSKSTLVWALCGADAKALDLKKLEGELAAGNVKPDQKAEVLKEAAEMKAKAMKVGAAMDAAAKDDPGLQQLFKVTEQAKAEWTAYLAKNKAEFERYQTLKDAVRSGKTNNPAFKGCYEATKAPFERLVKSVAKKIPWDVGNDYLPGYISYLVTTPENYITTVNWAACAWSIHESGEAPYVAAVNGDFRGLRAGWRTIALGKVFDEKFKPKFADRSLKMDDWTFQWKYGVKMSGVNDNAAIMTRSEAVVGSLKADGEVTKVAFKGDKVESCLQWKETNKVTGISAGGQPMYEKKCLKRGMVDNQETALEVPTKYMAGVKPGDTFASVRQFPVVAWKGKKLTSLLGVALK